MELKTKSKGGRPLGSKKMSVHEVREIRTAYRNGYTVGEIASEFGKKYQTVYSIVKRSTWKYI